MQIMITHGRMSRMHMLHLSGWQLGLLGASLLALLMLLSGAIYHFVFLTAAREGWPVVSAIVRLVVRDEIEQRDRYMRENLDAMAQRVGEMQAKVVRLESVGERVSSLAGLRPDDLRATDTDTHTEPKAGDNGPVKATISAPAPRPANSPASPVGGGRGGPYIPIHSPSLAQLDAVVSQLDARADRGADVFTLIESRLSEKRLQALLVPSIAPVDGPVGSGFGFRYDPFNSRPALHTGLDFPAEPGTPIHAAAGGMVISAETQPAYGLTVEVDHGNGLVTRYAHTSATLVKAGDLVRRGQLIARVGNSGRSTGPHLHFEVLLDGAPQDPAKFLQRAQATSTGSLALSGRREAAGPTGRADKAR